MSTHAYMLVLLLSFLYFWYRKQESYMTQDGQTVVRKNIMHKWAIPLAWVLGFGIAMPAAALASLRIDGHLGMYLLYIYNIYYSKGL